MQDSRAYQARRQLSPGTRLNGVYEIDRLIAVGGMGEIYKGHTIQTNDAVAIKMMLPELVQNASALALFRKEASALHNLHHDAIVRYYLFSVEPVLQRPYLAMEYVEGHSLSQLLQHGPLTFEAVRTLMLRLTSGFQAAHERGLVHRDVSPDNVIIPAGGDVGRAKIIDFGIVRTTQPNGQGTVIGNAFAGKYNYVSPEQLGLFGGEVTAKSDIYSLGLVLFEALTGTPLNMGGNQFQVVEKRRKVPDLGAIDMRIRPLIDRMLQPSPADRPDSMTAVAKWPLGVPQVLRKRDLDRLEGEPKDGGEAVAPRPRRRLWPLVAGGGGLAGVAAVGAAIYFLQPAIEPAKPAPPSPPPLQSTEAPPVQSADASQPPQPANPSATLAPPPSLTPAGGVSAPPLKRPAAAPGTPPPASMVAPSAPPGQATPPPASMTATAAPPAAGPGLAQPSQPAAPAAPAKPLSRAEQIARYIQDYDGGECFYITPVAVTAGSAKIEAYGAVVGPFTELDDAFKRAVGFEAEIGLRQVAPAQCAAVTFVSHLRRRAGAVRLKIPEGNLKAGASLSGTVERHGNSQVLLLLVSSTGGVENLSTHLRRAGSTGESFSLRLPRPGAGPPQPSLLVAITGAPPLDVLKAGQAMTADQLFPRLLQEAEAAQLPLAAELRYFKVER